MAANQETGKEEQVKCCMSGCETDATSQMMVEGGKHLGPLCEAHAERERKNLEAFGFTVKVEKLEEKSE